MQFTGSEENMTSADMLITECFRGSLVTDIQ